MISPQVGLNLHVRSGIAKPGMTDMTKAVKPWLMTMITFLMIVTDCPSLPLWLPRRLGMMS